MIMLGFIVMMVVLSVVTILNVRLRYQGYRASLKSRFRLFIYALVVISSAVVMWCFRRSDLSMYVMLFPSFVISLDELLMQLSEKMKNR